MELFQSSHLSSNLLTFLNSNRSVIHILKFHLKKSSHLTIFKSGFFFFSFFFTPHQSLAQL